MNPPQIERPDVPGHRLDAVIGQGATSVVWSGRDAVGRAVAVKVPRHGLDAVDLARADVERHALMAVRHAHLVSLRDVIGLDDGRVALVFDRVEGALLRTMVDSRGHLRPGEIVTVVTPVCEAVAALHAAGGVHGDVSPGNVMVGVDGRPMLLDLGSALVAGELPGPAWGTTGFVAPEVREGSRPNEASDVFALGALAWFCATGNGAPDTFVRLDRETVRSHVGDALAEVVGACIDPDPARRPSSAELPRRFYDAARPEPVEVVVGHDEASALTHRLRLEAGAHAELPAGTSRRHFPNRRGVLVLLVVMVTGLGGWVLRAAALGGPLASEARGGTSVTAPAGASMTAGPAPASGRTPGASSPPSPSSPSSPPSPSSRPVAGRSATPTGVVDPIFDPQAPRTRAAALVQALADRRSLALVARDESLLGGVHRAGSPSWSADARLVADLVGSGVRWRGLRFEVGRATFLAGGTSRAVVRARVDCAAYDVVPRNGAVEHRRAERGDPLDFSLVSGVDGWRLAEISAAAE